MRPWHNYLIRTFQLSPHKDCVGSVDNYYPDVLQPLFYGLTAPAFINNNLGSITLYTGFPVDWNSEKTRPSHEKTDDWNTYRNVFLDIDGCLRPSNWAGLARKEQLGQCAWIPYPGEAPAMANPYALEAKKNGEIRWWDAEVLRGS